MGNVKKEDILDILDKYDKSDITIATLGSHTSLHILQGAKEEGFRTAIVCEKGREIPYQRFGVADEYIIVDKFKDIVNEDVQQKLRDMNAIVIPHGSFVAYAGLDNVEDKFNVPMFGNRDILRWEAERDKERQLLVEGGVRIPLKYDSPSEIDRPVMVKFPGARGGRGYFVASSTEEFESKIEAMKLASILRDSDFIIEMDYKNVSMKPQFKLCDKVNPKYIIIIGETERLNGIYTVKNSDTKVQENVKKEDLISYLKNNRGE